MNSRRPGPTSAVGQGRSAATVVRDHRMRMRDGLPDNRDPAAVSGVAGQVGVKPFGRLPAPRRSASANRP